MSRKLNEIVSELRGLLFTLEENQGELDERLEQDLDTAEEELSAKVDAMLSACDDMDAKASVYKDRASAFTAASKRLEANSKRIQHWIVINMQNANVKKIESDNYPNIALRSSVSVEVDPVEFCAKNSENKNLWNIKPAPAPTPNKKAIKDAINSGWSVDGASLRQNWNLNYKAAQND
jgi:hypothetical protein